MEQNKQERSGFDRWMKPSPARIALIIALVVIFTVVVIAL